MKKKYPSLSVCMIVKNEEENLPRLLSSIKGLVDEVVLVDTGSTDNTVRIAQDFGARVFHFPWCNDFSAARNESLKHATKDFVLWLDGDDEVTETDHYKIKAHLRKYPGAGAYLRTYVEGEGQALQLRIFPNHRGVRFAGRIHEQVIGSLQAKGIPIYTCEAAILHHGYEEPQATVEKLRRNRKLLEEELTQRPEDPNIPFFLARTCSGLGELELSLTYLDMVLDREREDPGIRAQTAFRLGLFDKANILALLGRIDDALSVLAHGKTLSPQSSLIFYLSGKLHFERKEYREAFEDLLPLKDETFKNENAPINIIQVKAWLRRALGVSALFVDNFSVAEECFIEAVQTDPSDMAAYHHLAVARERKGDLDGAVAACRLGLERNGEDTYLRKRLFLLLLKGEHFSQALDCYETLNGSSMDVDALAGRFLLSCKALDPVGMQLYYRRLQERLSVAPLDFPQNLHITKDRLRASDDLKSAELFDSAVAFLLSQAA